ncbi:MAG: OFA family MFS transporter [Gammaproteobacteria bacterium]|nr:OFA family MFS transporter [Gammaproteobacteria bacterium]
MQAKPRITLAASMLVTFVLGSVHAFSVFIVPLELLFELARSEISLIYSLALVAITLAVTIGYRIYGLLPAWWLVFITCLVAATGLLLASAANSWWMLVAGYSLAFGFSNGVGYGYSLQLVGRVMPHNKGFSMGAVTAAYAVGSIVFVKIFALRITQDSVASAFLFIAVALLLCGCLAALMLRYAGALYDLSGPAESRTTKRDDRRKLLQFWIAYLSSVFAGLMAIGHAAGIAESRGAAGELATWAAMIIGIGSALGGFVTGWLVDRWSATRFLVGLPLISAGALLCIGVKTSAQATLALLGIVGFSYGAIIAIYPVAISNYFGEQGPQVYGRIFIAWGFAGLLAPWSAGLIYDLRGDYELAMVIAAVVALLSAVCAGGFRLGKTT